MGQEHFDSLIWRVHDYHPDLIKRVVYLIPDLIIQNPESTYADLAMGGGQFLQGILNRCIELGQSREQILPRLFGFERSKVYLNYARWRNNLQGVNLAILDPERDLDSVSMKFDVVIGNPPYQSPKNVNGAKSPQPLWRKFLVKSSDLIEDGGYIYLLVPSSVAKFHCEGKVSPALQKVPDLSVLSIDTSLESFFKVGTEISLISFTKGNQEEFIQLNGKPWNWKEMPWVPRVSDENSVSLLQKLFSIKGRLKFVPQYHWKPLDVNTNTSVGTWGMNRGKDYGIQSLQGFENLERKVHLMCCEFPNQNQQEKAILLFKSPVYRFLKSMLMFGSDVAFSTLSSLPVPDGWKSINSIEEATSLFKLTSKELQIIEKY